MCGHDGSEVYNRKHREVGVVQRTAEDFLTESTRPSEQADDLLTWCRVLETHGADRRGCAGLGGDDVMMVALEEEILPIRATCKCRAYFYS